MGAGADTGPGTVWRITHVASSINHCGQRNPRLLVADVLNERSHGQQRQDQPKKEWLQLVSLHSLSRQWARP